MHLGLWNRIYFNELEVTESKKYIGWNLKKWFNITVGPFSTSDASLEDNWNPDIDSFFDTFSHIFMVPWLNISYRRDPLSGGGYQTGQQCLFFLLFLQDIDMNWCTMFVLSMSLVDQQHIIVVSKTVIKQNERCGFAWFRALLISMRWRLLYFLYFLN